MHIGLSIIKFKEVDIVPFTFGQDLENLKHMEIAVPLWISPLKIMQPWPEEQSRLKVTIRPFQLPVCFNNHMLIIHLVNFHIDFWERFGYVF